MLSFEAIWRKHWQVNLCFTCVHQMNQLSVMNVSDFRGWCGAVDKSVHFGYKSLCVRIQAALDLSRQSSSDRSTSKCSAKGVGVTILGGYHHKLCPMSQFVWHAKKPSLRNDLKCRAYLNILQPFTGNGEVFIWMKNSRVRHPPPKKNKMEYI